MVCNLCKQFKRGHRCNKHYAQRFSRERILRIEKDLARELVHVEWLWTMFYHPRIDFQAFIATPELAKRYHQLIIQLEFSTLGYAAQE